MSSRNCSLRADAAGAGFVTGSSFEGAEAWATARTLTHKPVATSDELRGSLKKRLPSYTIPGHFVTVDAFPPTPSGKVDRRSLPAPENAQRKRETDFVPPRDLIEYELVQIWEEILGVRPIGTTDNFFELGGDSLLAVRVMDAIEGASGQSLPVSACSGVRPSIHLAPVLRQSAEIHSSPAMAIHPEGARPPFFFLHGAFGGGGFYCLNLARALGPEQPFFAVHPHGINARPMPATIEAMATDHLATVRALQPRGPYRLGGLCNGALIAFEMARRLQVEGEQVDFLALLDVPTKNIWLGAGLVRALVERLGALQGLTREARLKRFVSVGRCILRLSERARHYRTRLRELSGSGLEDWVAALRGKAKQTGKRLIETLAGRIKPAAFFRDSPRIAWPTASPDRSLLESYRLAVEDYIPRRYAGEITIFRSENGLWGQPDVAWRRLAPKVEIHIVPGDHFSFITWHVRVLGELLSACLADCPAPEGAGAEDPQQRGPSVTSERSSWNGPKCPVSESTTCAIVTPRTSSRQV